MKTAIMTDTNSGIPANNDLGCFVLPMPVSVDGRTYTEGVDITHAQLYAAMRHGLDIHSSQPSPGDFIAMWDNILKVYDQVVYIPMSSGLSGSCKTAQSFAEGYDERVLVVDNHRISVTLYESVLEAMNLVGQGKSGTEIKKHLEDTASQSSIYITVSSLEYLKRSGRVTAAGAAIAGVLNLKPVLTIQGGKLDAFAKIRGMKASQKRMVEAVRQDIETRFAGRRVRIGAAGTFEDPEDAKAWRRRLAEAFPETEVYYQSLSCSIACHVGIDAAGVGVS